jgi:hypothetical protein
MLQIIGFLGCVYLIVKACELGSSSAHRDTEGALSPSAAAGILVASAGALGFAVWIFVQGASVSNYDLPRVDTSIGDSAASDAKRAVDEAEDAANEALRKM